MHKRAMLLDSMKRAHLAYTRLLATLIPDIERFASMTKKARNAEMQTHIYRFVRPRPLGQATKAGIRIDVQGQINSYIELRQDQEGAQIPTASRLNEESVAYEAALAELASLGSDIERENTLRDDIARLAKSSRLRPVSYYGNTRGFYLFLWNESADRYFVWLNLHSEASRFAKPVTVKDLVDMRTGKLVSFTSQTGAIFPLELGQSFHDVGFINRGRPQSAKLVHCSQRNGRPCDDFEVHITFEWQTPKREVVHWLGIDRGIYNLAAYAITDELGRAINVGGISGRELRHVQRQEERRIGNAQQLGKITRGWARRRAWADEAVHVACNRIVQLAVEHHARVVVEELKNLSAVRRRKRTPGTRRGGFNKLLNRAQYEKLRKVLIYKLGEQGLPEPVPVRPAYTSMTCPECGHVAKENRRKEISADGFALEEFRCIACGYQAHADENAARVIAIKGAWFTGLPTRKERTWTEIPDELKFEAFVKNCAARRKGGQRPQGSYLCAPRPGS